MWSKAANGLTKSSWLLILTTPSPAPPPLPPPTPIANNIWHFLPPELLQSWPEWFKNYGDITPLRALHDVKNNEKSTYFALVALLQKDLILIFFFQVKCSSWRRRHSKNLMTFLVSQFSLILSQPYFEGSKMRFF